MHGLSPASDSTTKYARGRFFFLETKPFRHVITYFWNEWFNHNPDEMFGIIFHSLWDETYSNLTEFFDEQSMYKKVVIFRTKDMMHKFRCNETPVHVPPLSKW